MRAFDTAGERIRVESPSCFGRSPERKTEPVGRMELGRQRRGGGAGRADDATAEAQSRNKQYEAMSGRGPQEFLLLRPSGNTARLVVRA